MSVVVEGGVMVEGRLKRATLGTPGIAGAAETTLERTANNNAQVVNILQVNLIVTAWKGMNKNECVIEIEIECVETSRGYSVFK
jgi:hypothetical protein